MSEPTAPPRKGDMPMILVVDDEVEVLEVTSAALEEAGYRTLTANSPAAALDLLRGPAEVDLLLTDIVMPGPVNGLGLAEAARELRPGLKVLYASGFVKTAPFGLGAETGTSFGRLVNKPWRFERLYWAVEEALDAGPEG